MTLGCDRTQVGVSAVTGPLRLGMRTWSSEGAPANLSKRLCGALSAEHGQTECQIPYSADIYRSDAL